MTNYTSEGLALLGKRFGSLQLRLASLQGQARELNNQSVKLTKSIGLAKARIELAPQAAEVFTFLQEKAHQRAVGEFEDLLTSFVADVVPDAGKIRLELGTERGAPALDILLDNGGDLENILEGNGGGLTNVVVTGLAFSALSRTDNRQFMILDEPDCWLKSIYVPNFTKVIAEVANPRVEEEGSHYHGCQTLLISHNDLSLINDAAHVQELKVEHDISLYAAEKGFRLKQVGEKSDCAHVVWVPDGPGKKGSLEVRYRHDGMGDAEQNALTKGYPYMESVKGARTWTEDQEGVRWVEVINLRHHVHTRMELSPGLNVITGDINTGKSTLYVTAFRAMAYGETDDTMIRHGADAAIIRIGVENDMVLEMTRTRKGSPKVLYRLYKGTELLNEGRQESRGTGVPPFVLDVLKIDKVDGMDIQLRSQKQPVFLLNETPSRRAQLLSVGRESGLLLALIEKHRKELRADRESLKREEAELSQTNRTLTVMNPLAGMTALVSIITELQSEAEKTAQTIEGLRGLTNKLTPLTAKLAVLTDCEETLLAPLTVPTVADTSKLKAHIERLQNTQAVANLPSVPEAPAMPKITATEGLRSAVEKLDVCGKMLSVAKALPAELVKPEINNTTTLRSHIEKMTKCAPADAILAHIPDAPVTPKLKECSTFKEFLVKMQKQHTEGHALASAEKQIVKEEAEAKASLDKLKADLGVCPCCGSSFHSNEQHKSGAEALI